MLHPTILAAKHRGEALRAIRNHKYEVTEAGIFIPGMNLDIAGAFEVAVGNGPFEVCPNLVVTEGRNYLLDAALSQASQIAALVIAPFSGNVTPAATWTAANFDTNATEFTNYDEANRVAWVEGGPSAGAIGNTANPAVFTIGTGGGTIRGLALIGDAAAKQATSGKLIAAARLNTDKVMDATEELKAKYTITLSST